MILLLVLLLLLLPVIRADMILLLPLLLLVLLLLGTHCDSLPLAMLAVWKLCCECSATNRQQAVFDNIIGLFLIGAQCGPLKA
jgi:hypothetical protein